MDDDRPRPKSVTLPRVLDTLSIEDLNDYIAMLEAEIARVRQDISQKSSARESAASFFKT